MSETFSPSYCIPFYVNFLINSINKRLGILKLCFGLIKLSVLNLNLQWILKSTMFPSHRTAVMFIFSSSAAEAPFSFS